MAMIPDLRKCTQLHQSKRYASREKTNRHSSLRHLHSGLIDKKQPARSWIRDQLIDFNNEIPEEYPEDDIPQYLEDYWDQREIAMYMNAQWVEIYDALKLNNADLLDCLMPPINVLNGKEKYWALESDVCYYRAGIDILLIAIALGHTDCIRVLLDKFYSGDLDPAAINSSSSYNRTPLLCACEKDDLNLVQELVEHAHANIHQYGILLAAIKQNHKIMVEYLLSQGCDPQSRFNDNALHEASRYGYLEIVQSLLKYGADPNKWGYTGQTALDYAIHEQHIEIAQVLLSHTGDYITANRNNFTPMMQAAHHDLKPIVSLLFQLLPIDRAADDLLRLACRYTIESPMQNREKALYFFRQGFYGKQTSDKSSLSEVYELHRECQTFDQLESIRDDDNALRMHALIVNERLFLQHGDLAFYIDLIEKQCNHYINHQLFNHSLQLRIHGYQSILRVQNHSVDSQRFRQRQFEPLVENLQSILRQSGEVPIDSLVIICNWMFNQIIILSNSIRLDLLKIIICMIQFKQTTQNEQNVLCDLVRRFVQQQPIRSTLLACFIQDILNDGPFQQCDPYSLSTLSIIYLLIQCGADVNQICDYQRNRPLHLIAKCSDILIAKPTIELLLSAGAHIDTIDYMGRSPKDIAHARDVKEFFVDHDQLSLKCRCAQMIVSKKINYQNHLTSRLATFVQLHSNLEPNPLSDVFSYHNYSWENQY